MGSTLHSDPSADPSWVGATAEEDQVIPRRKPNLEPFFYSYEVYVMREANLPNGYPWYCCVRRCESIPPVTRDAHRRRSCRRHIWNLENYSP